MVARKDELNAGYTGSQTDVTDYKDENSSNEIKADIDETRSRMDDTIDRLGERLRPRNLLDNFMDYFRSGEGGSSPAGEYAQCAFRNSLNFVKKHPGPVGLIAAGLVWMMMESDDDELSEPLYGGTQVDARTGLPYSEEHYGAEWKAEHGRSGVMSKARDAISGVKERAGDWMSSARHGASRLGETVSEQSSHLGSNVRNVGSSIRSGYSYSSDQMQHLFERYPLVVGLGAVALGVAAGMVLPQTRREDRLLGETAANLKGKVSGSASELYERSKEAASHLYERGKEAAKAVASEALDEAKVQGSEIVDEAKSQFAEAGKSAGISSQAGKGGQSDWSKQKKVGGEVEVEFKPTDDIDRFTSKPGDNL